MANNATLTVCMIVKNEAQNLERAIASVKSVADEIVVVDTGSTDGTPDVARSSGAVVVEHVWEDDFSKARNKAIETATSDWIFFLDADEYLPEESIAEIESALAKGADAYFVRIESPLRSGAGKVFVNSFPRLFRRLPGVRFEGRVHEQILPSLLRLGAKVIPSAIVIRHLGYDLSREKMDEKLRRNLRMLEMQLDEIPQDSLTLFHLGETHNLLGEYGRAVEYYQDALGKRGLPKQIRAVCLQNLASALIKLRRYEEALKMLEGAKRLNPNLLSTHLVKSSALFGLKLYEEAETEIVKYLKKVRGRGLSTSYRLDFDPDVPSALVLVAKCRLARGEIETARKALKDALKMGENYDARILLARLAFEEMKFSEAVIHFEEALKICDEDERLHFELSKSYLACGEIAKAIEVLTNAVERGMGGSQFLKCLGILKIKAKDFGGAAAAYEAAISMDPQDSDARKKLAGLYHHLGKEDLAVAVLTDGKQM